MEIRVGRWDCKACGSIGNIGPDTHCGQCGSTRPKDVVFYLPKDEKVIKDQEKIKEALGGADWVCTYCSSNNKSFNSHCTTCGNDREQEEKTLEQRQYTLDEVPNATPKTIKRVHPDLQPEPTGKAKWFQRVMGAAGLGGVFAFLFSINTIIDVPVVAMEWERQIEVQEYKEVKEKAWSMPSDGKLISSEEAIYGYNQKLIRYETRTRTVQRQIGTRREACGQRDLGNGYFETVYCNVPVYENVQERYEEPIYQDIPIYKTQYTYLIWKWTKSEPLLAKGTDKNVFWPKERIEMRNNKNFRTGKERERYRFTIEDHKGELHEYEETDFEAWDAMNVGDSKKAIKSKFFGTFKKLVDETE